MQTELLDRRRWKTRVELANAIFEYLEIFHSAMKVQWPRWAGGLHEATHHTPEHIIRKLREADRLLGEGREIPEVAKALEVSEATYHRWRAQYDGLKADDAKHLKELQAENSRLKRLLAEAELEKDALRELAKGNF
jgi:putative transposase